LATAYGKMWNGYADVRTCKMRQNTADVKNTPRLVRVRNLPRGTVIVVRNTVSAIFKSSLVSHLHVLTSALYPRPLAAIIILQSFEGNVQLCIKFQRF